MSVELQQDNAHVEEAFALLPEQFKNSENMKVFIEAFIDRVQDIEEMLIALWQGRWLDNAAGAQLDRLGTIVGETRDAGMSDNTYRARIRMRIFLNRSSGLASDITSVFALLLQDDTPPVSIVEYFPAGLVVYVDEFVSVDATTMADILSQARATAVNTQLVYLSAAADHSFSCASADASETSTTEGFDGFIADLGSYDYVWTAETAAEANQWWGVTYGYGLFVAVGHDGTHHVMTSPDAVTWTGRTTNSNSYYCACWSEELGLFVIAGAGIVSTSPDGINWTDRSPASFVDNWNSVCWSPSLNLFCAVSLEGNIMTSPNGTTWTLRTAAEANIWESVCWSPELGLFVAVSQDGTHRVMTSPDGITWTARTATGSYSWMSVAWSPTLGMFAAVSLDGTIMTSSNGTTWTLRTSPSAATWDAICWSEDFGLFIAVAITGEVMSSHDGITWTSRTSAESNVWRSVCYGAADNPTFCAVSSNGTHRVMLSDGSWITKGIGGEFADVMEA